MIDFQDLDGYLPDIGLRDEERAMPDKVVMPAILARMKSRTT